MHPIIHPINGHLPVTLVGPCMHAWRLPGMHAGKVAHGLLATRSCLGPLSPVHACDGKLRARMLCLWRHRRFAEPALACATSVRTYLPYLPEQPY